VTPAEALLPHEKHCANPECEDGYIVTEIMAAPHSASIEPVCVGTDREPCPDCDGTGVVLAEERRGRERNPDEKAWSDLERILTIDRDRLRRENESLRAMVIRLASDIGSLEAKLRAALSPKRGESPTAPDTGGERAAHPSRTAPPAHTRRNLTCLSAGEGVHQREGESR
jgi:hypothetical protein